MFGALLQATNPVAVIASLKSRGTSKRFITLFEGETLINNGTAMITFRVFMSLARGQDLSTVEVAGKLV